MSDYYGKARLEDWLAKEVFRVDSVPPNVVRKFEPWRDAIEQNILQWMESGDRTSSGNPVSWQGWGRGFNAISEEEQEEFFNLVRDCQIQLNIR